MGWKARRNSREEGGDVGGRGVVPFELQRRSRRCRVCGGASRRGAGPVRQCGRLDGDRAAEPAAAAMPRAYADVWKSVVPAGRRSPIASRCGVPRRRRAFAACAAFCAVPSLLQLCRPTTRPATAELRKVVLQDGSEVTLAPDSAIAVAYEPAGRQVRLLAGEAFFEVRPDASRPFRVLADTVETTVVGTSFDVRLSADGVVVSVEHGSCGSATASRGSARRLTGRPGGPRDIERRDLPPAGLARRRSRPGARVSSWRRTCRCAKPSTSCAATCRHHRARQRSLGRGSPAPTISAIRKSGCAPSRRRTAQGPTHRPGC